MRIVELSQNRAIYTCRSYLLLGDWNRIEDVNTLIDPGTDDSVLTEIESLSTGFGKNRVERIILTHNHFDHAAGTVPLKKHFGARVYAWCEGDGVDELLYDGQILNAGDSNLQVFHTPGHSSDSICLYDQQHKVLFSGDTLFCQGVGRTDLPYSSKADLQKSLRDLFKFPPSTKVFPGHGEETTIGDEQIDGSGII